MDSAAAPARTWWVSLNTGFAEAGYSVPLLTSTLQAHVPLGVGPLEVQGGVGGGFDLFGSGAYSEAHVALGAAVAVGPVLVSGAAGPAALDFSGRPGKAFPALYADARLALVVFPPFSIGVEGFVLANREMPVRGVGVSLAFGRQPARAVFPNPPPRPRPAR